MASGASPAALHWAASYIQPLASDTDTSVFGGSRCHCLSEGDAPLAPGCGASSQRSLMPLQTTRSTRLPRSSTSPPSTIRLTMSSNSSTCEEKWTIQGPWWQTLLSVFDVTSVRMILPNKKGLEGWLNLLLKDCTLLIGVHVFERVP